MKAYIIVPYRDREQHKNMFIPYMEQYLKNNLSNKFEIIFVEQENGKSFNRAKLLNIGVDITRSEEEKYFIFHDVDMLPIENGPNYMKPEKDIVHIATEVEQFKYRLPYDEYIGGVTIFDDFTFGLLNGYCNDYWGWGAEDDDLYMRIISKNLSISRRKQKYKSLSHTPNGDTDGGIASPQTINNRKLLSTKTLENVCISGYNTLDYSILEQEQISNFTKIYKVSV